MSTYFGQELSAFMKASKLTQQEVAERTGVAQPVIGRLLRTSQPELPTLRKIAEGLDVAILINGNDITFEAASMYELQILNYRIEPVDRPAAFEVEANCGTTFYPQDERYRVHFSMFDKIESRYVCTVAFIYRKGSFEPESTEFERQDWIPRYVSNGGLIDWAKAYAEKVLPWATG